MRLTTVSLFAVLMIDSLVNGLFIPLSLLYLVARSHASLTHIGVLITVAGVIALPLPLWIGRVVDRVGSRPVVIVAQALQAAGFAAYVMASSLVVVFVAATIASIGRAAYWSSIYQLLSGLTDNNDDPRARERWFGISGALRATGYGLGAVTAGFALSVNSVVVYQWIIGANAALLVVAGILVIAFVPPGVAPAAAPAKNTERGYRVLWADRPYLALIGLNTVFALCNVLLSVGVPPYVAHAMPGVTWVVGPLLGLNTLVQAVFQPLVVRLVRGIRRTVSLCLAGLLWALWSVGMLSALYLPGALRVVSLALGVLCYAAAQMLHSPTSNAMAADAAPLDVRGRYLAVFQSSFQIAAVAAPATFSALLGVGNPVPWIALSLAVGLTIPGMALLGQRLPRSAVTGVRAPQPAAVPA